MERKRRKVWWILITTCVSVVVAVAVLASLYTEPLSTEEHELAQIIKEFDFKRSGRTDVVSDRPDLGQRESFEYSGPVIDEVTANEILNRLAKNGTDHSVTAVGRRADWSVYYITPVPARGSVVFGLEQPSMISVHITLDHYSFESGPLKREDYSTLSVTRKKTDPHILEVVRSWLPW